MSTNRNREEIGPMTRIRSSSANEASKPILVMQRRQTHVGSKTLNFSPSNGGSTVAGKWFFFHSAKTFHLYIYTINIFYPNLKVDFSFRRSEFMKTQYKLIPNQTQTHTLVFFKILHSIYCFFCYSDNLLLKTKKYIYIIHFSLFVITFKTHTRVLEIMFGLPISL